MTATATRIEIEGIHVDVRDDGMVLDPCTRCASNGEIQAFRRIQGGICFGCGGTGGDWMTPDDAARKFRRRRKDRERRDAKRAAELAARDADADRFTADHPELAALLLDLLEEGGPQRRKAHPILVDMAERFAQYRTLTDKQVELAERLRRESAERDAARAAERAAAEPAPEGRTVVTGEIVGVKVTESGFGYHRSLVFRMTVRDDRGFRVNTTIPRDLVSEAHDAGGRADDLRGRRVTFTATLTPSDDDPTFAFGKRPTKAGLLAVES